MNYAFRYTLDFLARVIIIITTLMVLVSFTNIIDNYVLSSVVLLILLYWVYLPLRGLKEEIEREKTNDKKRKHF
jgi:4-amino-4-deoxy-L-arabinose transferase-like glycosyltransferase